jgi:CubicO group peptidase (beta-lactamase class C family)
MAVSLRSTRVDPAELTSKIGSILNRHPAVGLAVGVVENGSPAYFHCHGVANIATRKPITEDTGFRIASITKTFTAVAVMQLWEQGLVDLDAPANDYLRSYRLVPAQRQWPVPTVRQLLTHTGGVPEQAHPLQMFATDYGQTVPPGERLPSLAEYYGGHLRVAAEPGSTFMYGDHSFATLGQIVEDVSGKSLAEYFRDHIFAPLGMADSDVLRSELVESRLATGYEFTAHGPEPVVDRESVTTGASSIYSTARDMARYVGALLAGGGNEHGSVLKPETVATMFSAHYRAHPSFPGMGLGFFRGDLSGHPALEHQGIVPGFNSQIWLAPEDGVGLLAFTNGSPQAVFWMVTELGQLLRDLVGAPPDPIRRDVPEHPEIWSELCGWYEPLAPVTDPRSRMFLGAGAEVFVRDGRLRLRFLSPIPVFYRGFELHADSPGDPYVFGVDLSAWDIGKVHLAFNRDAAGRATDCALDFMPIGLRKRPDSRNPRRQAAIGLGIAGAGMAVLAARHWVSRHH